MFTELATPGMLCGPNDGGIKRGDRADTGDLAARPSPDIDEQGSGDNSALPGGPGASVTGKPGASAEDLDDLDVRDAADPTLGMTNIGNVPAQDWAADTGPTHTAEESLGEEEGPDAVEE